MRQLEDQRSELQAALAEKEVQLQAQSAQDVELVRCWEWLRAVPEAVEEMNELGVEQVALHAGCCRFTASHLAVAASLPPQLAHIDLNHSY